MEYLKKSYLNEGIWATHETELLNIINYANQAGIEIAFVVWPFLHNIEESQEFTTKVVNFLRARNIMVLDLAKHFKD